MQLGPLRRCGSSRKAPVLSGLSGLSAKSPVASPGEASQQSHSTPSWRRPRLDLASTLSVLGLHHRQPTASRHLSMTDRQQHRWRFAGIGRELRNRWRRVSPFLPLTLSLSRSLTAPNHQPPAATTARRLSSAVAWLHHLARLCWLTDLLPADSFAEPKHMQAVILIYWRKLFHPGTVL
ncbi:hypothetical protein G7Z17_g11992 [Cylindrodendrum hubeiense]|uniref:Uncharacterized protein n=1 Tax=Cylindrodendrum hubeiense TaxID=595255 RepID=A0A9P5L3G9_9HYPO|nr:hypothetical protein G7Z17_g11992 [Cylindrodendrum hubeiense]